MLQWSDLVSRGLAESRLNRDGNFCLLEASRAFLGATVRVLPGSPSLTNLGTGPVV